MHCLLTRADGASIHTNLTLTPVRYSANALGGPDAATVSVSGDKNALSVKLIMRNGEVWPGLMVSRLV